MKHQFIRSVAFAAALFPSVVLALVGIHETGTWPDTWPDELEPLRKQARTFDVATGIQQQIHEIRFADRAEFQRIWPAILELMTPNAPVNLYWTDSVSAPAAWGSLLASGQPVVRVYSPSYGFTGGASSGEGATYAAMETLAREGRMLRAGPPWPAEIVAQNGALPEFVKAKEDDGNWRWVRADLGKDHSEWPSGAGFLYRARVDLDVVVDGEVIDLAGIFFPWGTVVHSDRHPIPEVTTEQLTAIITEAGAAYSQHVRRDPNVRGDEIPERFWGPTIRGLKPLRVVDDRANIKVVLADAHGVEGGFYVQQAISSFSGFGDYFLEYVSLSEFDPEAFTFGSIARYKLAHRPLVSREEQEKERDQQP